MSRRPALLAVALALAPAGASASAPAPDRPSVSANPRLAAVDTVEAELGAAWRSGEPAGVPLLAKYSLGGLVEPRVAVDLRGVGVGRPGLGLGAKVLVVDRPGLALSVLAESSVPVGEGEALDGRLALLAGAELPSGVGFAANAGARIGPVANTVGVVSVPLSGLVSVPFTELLGGYAEAAWTLGSDGPLVVDGGLTFAITESAVLDLAGGWDLSAGVPFATAGATVNLGRPGF